MQPTAFPDPPALETRLQFTVRSVLVGTTLVAVGVALVAPWFRRWTADQRTAFLSTWCYLAGGAGVAILVAWVQRVHSERRAGPARYRLPRSKTWPAVCLALFWSTLLIGYSLLKVLQPGGVAVAHGWWPDAVAIQYGAMFALAALGIWWRGDCLELCDAGLLRGSLLIPWEAFRGFRWGAVDPNVLILQGRWGITTWRVRPDGKAEVEQFLANHLRSGSSPATAGK
jgi:hypothetical protein